MRIISNIKLHMVSGTLVFALGVGLVAPAVASAASDLAPSEEAFLKNEGDRPAIPYTRFWIYAESDIVKLTVPYYLRSTTSKPYPYTGTDTVSSYYTNYPTNWRLIRSGSYRLLKNSSSGRCMWADARSDGSVSTSMTTCDSSNSHQRFIVSPVVVDGMQKVKVYYTEGVDTYCMSAITPIKTGSLVGMAPCYASNAVKYWSYANLR